MAHNHDHPSLAPTFPTYRGPCPEGCDLAVNGGTILSILETPGSIHQVPADETALLELQLLARANELGELEKARDEEFLLQVVAKVNSFQAQRQAEHRFGPAIRVAQAEYDIALQRLRRA